MTKTYIGNTKNKLFIDYSDHIKNMIKNSKEIHNSLLEIIEKLFIHHVKDSEDKINTKVESYTIHPNLTNEKLQDLIIKSRNIIIRLYVRCEKDFIIGLQILEAIIEMQIFETSKRQEKSLIQMIETINTI